MVSVEIVATIVWVYKGIKCIGELFKVQIVSLLKGSLDIREETMRVKDGSVEVDNVELARHQLKYIRIISLASLSESWRISVRLSMVSLGLRFAAVREINGSPIAW